MNIEDKTLEELKVLAYDCIVIIETQQKNLQILNAEMARKVTAPVEAPVTPESTEPIVEPSIL